eukprot:CAMPEP_0197600344 /NCGR_PEP_ID=MMETSP1326-20131121/33099_1 /TAXON_ID=1155430 /ORGANISM="Genus nov. species nov., Strain RCC2288" /LENGTH=92 /DNA_ID=CAMNT_0043167437 /DNA_START=178 /DNA_END=452 /DNA_ORIENTATION=+
MSRNPYPYPDLDDVDMDFGHEAFLPPPVKDLFALPTPKGGKGKGKKGGRGGFDSEYLGPSDLELGGGGYDLVLPPLPPIAGKTDKQRGGGNG